MERKSDREMIVSRTISGPARLVFEAWTKPDLLRQWWVPKSAPIQLVTCEVDARVGGRYRLVFAAGASLMEFTGKYLEVTPHSRIVWTNEEAGPDAVSITTVTFEQKGSSTLVTMSELHPTKESLDAHIGSGAASGPPAQFEQLEEFIVGLVSKL